MRETTCNPGAKFCQKIQNSETGLVVRFFPKTLNMIQALFNYLTCRSILIGLAWMLEKTDAQPEILTEQRQFAFATLICAMGRKSSEPNHCSLPSLLPCWQSS